MALQRTEPNNATAMRSTRITNRIANAITTGIPATAAIYATAVSGNFFTVTVATGIMGALAAMFSMPMRTTHYYRTHAIPDGMDVGSVEAMIAMLVHVSHEGLARRDRQTLQSTIDQASDVLTAMLGRTPFEAQLWSEITTVPARLHMRGEMLASKAPGILKLMRLANRPGGVGHRYLTVRLSAVTTVIEALARDFGLDPAGFGRRDDGSERHPDRPKAIQAVDDALPSSPTRRLAQEWLDGSHGGIDPDTAGSADDAAGRDLDALETTWKEARRHASDSDIATIDEEFSRSCSILSGRLTSAIVQRSAHLRDGMVTNRRYLEAKHPQDDGLTRSS